jgi:hypothetical protein
LPTWNDVDDYLEAAGWAGVRPISGKPRCTARLARSFQGKAQPEGRRAFSPAPSVVISEIHVPGVCFGRGAAIAGRAQ